MLTKGYLPLVKDLFFDICGVEADTILSKSLTFNGLFESNIVAWEPLNRLQSLLKSMTSVPARETQIQHRSLSVKLNTRCLYPCVQDVHIQGPSYPILDNRALLLRGGLRLTTDSSAKLLGPAYIGPRVQLRHNAGILGEVIIGDGLTYRQEPEEQGEAGAGGILGYSVTARRSIIRSGAKICASTELADCIIGKNVQIGPGSQFGHENFSGRSVSVPRMDGVTFSDCAIETGRKKLSILIGDDCHVGANVTALPGVILLPGCRVPGGTILHSGIYSPKYFSERNLLS